MPNVQQWFEHAETAGFVFLAIRRGAKETHVAGWTSPGSTPAGKFASADEALAWRGPGRGNLGVGIEDESRLRILNTADARAANHVMMVLLEKGVRTLSMVTPRGSAYLFRLPDGVDIPPLNERECADFGIGAISVCTAGQYQVAPGSVVYADAYGEGAHSGESDHRIRWESDHRIRRKVITGRSEATRELDYESR